MRKKKLIAFAVLVLLLIPIGLLLLPSGPDPQIIGNISAKDLAEIKSAARHEIWKGTFPDFSWFSIKHLPSTINSRWHMRLVRIEAKTNDTVDAFIAITGKNPSFLYVLKRGTNGWSPLASKWITYD